MDKYDKAVKYLTEHPEKIKAAWDCPANPYDDEDEEEDEENVGGPLFCYVTPNPFKNYINLDGGGYQTCGCLTQVARGIMPGCNDELTSRIRSDKRIPHNSEDITVNDLEVFAEWQRILDKELNRA